MSAVVRRQFQMTLFEGISELADLFNSAGLELYVVGGAVRDAVMGVPPKDYDLATNATPDRVVELLANSRGWSYDEVGRAFGVVRARCTREGVNSEYEIATFRQDIGAGRRPDRVVFTTIDEDVKRRDLTINAMFYDLHTHEIIDLVGGIADIDAKVVRTVGDPAARFAEDRLRVLRAIRFAARFDFDIEAQTLRAIERDNNLDGVSFERIHDEVTKAIAGAKNIDKFFDLMRNLDMWKRVLPGLHVTLNPALVVSRRPTTVLALLLDENDNDKIHGRLLDLKYSSSEANAVSALLYFRDLTPQSAYKLRKIINRCNVQSLTLIDYALHRMQPSTTVVAAFCAYLIMQPVKGDDLLAEGFSGRALRDELERREQVIYEQLLGDAHND